MFLQAKAPPGIVPHYPIFPRWGIFLSLIFAVAPKISLCYETGPPPACPSLRSAITCMHMCLLVSSGASLITSLQELLQPYHVVPGQCIPAGAAEALASLSAQCIFSFPLCPEQPAVTCPTCSLLFEIFSDHLPSSGLPHYKCHLKYITLGGPVPLSTVSCFLARL